MKRILMVALCLGLATACDSGAKKPPVKKTPAKVDKPKGDKSDGDKPKADKPAPKAKPLERSAMKSPWKNARVGTWIEFKPHFGGPAFRYEITKVDEGSVSFSMSKKDGDKWAKVREITQSNEDLEKTYNDPYKLEPKPEIAEVELKVGDKTLKCLHIKRVGAGNKTETWLCMDMPLNGGVVKSINGEDLQLQVVGFELK